MATKLKHVRIPTHIIEDIEKCPAVNRYPDFTKKMVEILKAGLKDFGGTSDPPAEEIANMKNVTQYLLRRIDELEGEVRELRGKKSGDDPGQAYPRRSSAV